MLWRKFRLDWSYALGELLIVTIGVLIALAINEWNEERSERAEEANVIARIITNLDQDLKAFEFRLNALDAKEESLLRVRVGLAKTTIDDPHALLRDIIIGADFGWNQGLPQRATYDALLGSGQLGIISEPNINILIAGYYRSYEDSNNRIEERETIYPSLSYQLVPRHRTTWDGVGIVWEREVESGLSDTALMELAELVHDSTIAGYVTAEINLSRFIRGITLNFKNRANLLVTQLEEYHATIQ